MKDQPERGVIAHKLVFSLSEDERDRLGVKLRDLVREVMAAWSQHLGKALTWIGFEHDDPGHPHVHVVVAGYAEGRQVGVYERDLRAIREWAEREKDRHRPVREVERPVEKEVDRLLRDIGREVTRERLERSVGLIGGASRRWRDRPAVPSRPSGDEKTLVKRKGYVGIFHLWRYYNK